LSDARYTDLERVEPPVRGQVLMAKVVADQSMGAAHAVWLGMLMAWLNVGMLAVGGTLAAGFLGRRGDRRRACVLPYLEMTLPLSVTLAVTLGSSFSSAWSTVTAGFLPLVGLVGLTGLAVAGAVGRWSWVLRLSLAFTWLVLLIHLTHSSVPWFVPVLAVALTAFVLFRHLMARYTSSRRLAPQPSGSVALP
jgi:hypothetical protein